MDRVTAGLARRPITTASTTAPTGPRSFRPGRSDRRRLVGPLVVAALVAAAVTVASVGPVAAQTDDAPPTVEVVWTNDYAPHGDPIPALQLTVEGAGACTLPSDVDGLGDDPGRGVTVTIDGTEVYRTGGDNIVIDDDYAGFDEEPGAYATRSLVDYYAADAFVFHSVQPDLDRMSSAVTISCRGGDGTWRDIVDRRITRPDGPDIHPFLVGHRVGEGDGLLHLAFTDSSYTHTVPDAGDLAVTVDGRPVTLSPYEDPGYGEIFGAFAGPPPAGLDPGLHTTEVAWNGRIGRYPLVVDDPASLRAPAGHDGPAEPAGDGSGTEPGDGEAGTGALAFDADGPVDDGSADADGPVGDESADGGSADGDRPAGGAGDGGAPWPLIVGAGLLGALALGSLTLRRWL